jgi:hypothetical protein
MYWLKYFQAFGHYRNIPIGTGFNVNFINLPVAWKLLGKLKFGVPRNMNGKFAHCAVIKKLKKFVFFIIKYAKNTDRRRIFSRSFRKLLSVTLLILNRSVRCK